MRHEVPVAMAKKLFLILIAAAICAAVSGPLFAHHGTAAFNTSKTVTVEGVITDFQFFNPHCEVYFDVKNDKGEIEKWDGELTAPNKLARAGWSKETLKPGDKVTVSGYPGKSAPHTLWIQKLIGPDGKSIPLRETTD